MSGTTEVDQLKEELSRAQSMIVLLQEKMSEAEQEAQARAEEVWTCNIWY